VQGAGAASIPSRTWLRHSRLSRRSPGRAELQMSITTALGCSPRPTAKRNRARKSSADVLKHPARSHAAPADRRSPNAEGRWASSAARSVQRPRLHRHDRLAVARCRHLADLELYGKSVPNGPQDIWARPGDPTQIFARACSISCGPETAARTTAAPIALRLASSLFRRGADEFRDGSAPQRSL
jgi:hypothetical protein